MIKLYSHNFCPKSRFIKILLHENQIDFEEEKIDFWREKPKIMTIDPLGELPIIKITDDQTLSGIYTCFEYIKDLTPDSHLNQESCEEMANVRRMIHWLNTRFHKEVSAYFINEKIIKILSLKVPANTENLRIARQNFYHHCSYFQSFFNKYGNMTSNNLSHADFFLASHISVLDYFGEVNWDKLSWLKNWYAAMKSRPSFRQILKARLSVISPPSYYEDPDF